jgi:hypothetical protein
LPTARLAREFFAGEQLDIKTEYVTTNVMAAMPVSHPGGPKIMMGRGGKRVLATCDKMADIVSIDVNNKDGKIGAVGIGSNTADVTEQKIGWIRDHTSGGYDNLEIEMMAPVVELLTGH